MQTILGSTGPIGTELARELRRSFTSELRLVSRRPEKLHERDEVLAADLLDRSQALRAVEGAEVVYMAAGLPIDTQLWVAQWPVLMRNVIAACAHHGAKLVFFDNTYMYPQTDTPQTENTPFRPHGPKGEARATVAKELLQAMEEGRVEGLIGRAPEFYGPGKTQSITNAMVIDHLWARKPAQVLVRDDVLRTLIYTPDAARALARLGNTPDAYGETWHLPCDDDRLTYRGFVELAAATFDVPAALRVRKKWQLAVAGLVNQGARDVAELLPRYGSDNIFVSDKFKSRFPDFEVTSLRQGLARIRDERLAAAPA